MPGRLIAEGVQSLIAKRVNDLVDSITAQIVAEKVKELKPQIHTEISAIFKENPSIGLECLDVMLTITTKRGGR
jgi:DNA-directed RNA polymerase subunit F